MPLMWKEKVDSKFLEKIEAEVLDVKYFFLNNMAFGSYDNDSRLEIKIQNGSVEKLVVPTTLNVSKGDYVNAFVDLRMQVKKGRFSLRKKTVRRELESIERPYRLEILDKDKNPKSTYVGRGIIEK